MTTLDEWRDIALASLGLPDEKLLGVLSLVEKVPDRGHMREVLDHMRPRLVQLRPPRPLTAQRLLFRPVEDLFDPPERYRAKIGRLSRLTIQPCWLVVHTHIDQQLMQRTTLNLRTIRSSNATELYAVGLPFWQAATKVLAAFLEGDNSIGRRRVGTEYVIVSEDLRQQLMDITDILSIAAEIESVKIHLPERPINALSEVDIELLTEVIGRLGMQSTRKVETFILAILARMTRPGELLKVLAEVSLPCTTNERTGILKLVGTNALASLANEAVDLRKTNQQIIDPAEGARTAEQLVTRLTSLERSLGGLRDRAVSEQVQTARREIGSYVLDKLAVKADETLFENLRPTPAAVAKTGSTEPTIEQVETAEKCALSLRRCARVAESVGVRKEMGKKLTTVCSELEREAKSREPNGRPKESRLVRSVRLIELIAGPDEAQRVFMSQYSNDRED
ncbi:MAG: hypothetical protein WCF85_02340 [Rhodospirillaceae bacterium]